MQPLRIDIPLSDGKTLAWIYARGEVLGRRDDEEAAHLSVKLSEADLGRLALEEGMRDLHQDAGAVAEARVGADGAAMLEVAEDGERIGDDLMRLLALDVGNEADAAGIFLKAGIVEAFGGGTPSMQLARRVGRFRVRGRRQRFCHDMFALDFRPAHSPSPRMRAFLLTCFFGAPWAFHGTPGKSPGVTARPESEPYFQSSGSAFNVPGERLCLGTFAARGAEFRCNPYAGLATKFETVMLS